MRRRMRAVLRFSGCEMRTTLPTRLLPPIDRQRRVRAGRRASLRRSPLALRLPSGAQSRGPSPNSLRSLRSLRSNRRRQVSLRSALRARATSPALLSAEEAPSDLPERTFAAPAFLFAAKTENGCPRGGRYPAGAISGAVRSGGSGSARLRASTTDSPRLFERNERSEWSEFGGATLDRAPQRSRCTHRPLQHEPPPGIARCDAQERRP